MNLTVGQNQCGSLRHNALLEEADSVFLQPASKQAGHDGHQNQTTSATTQASLMRCSSRLPKRRQQHAGHRRHRVGAGENHQQGDQKLFPAPRRRTFTVGGVNQKAGSVRTSVRSPSVSSGAISATSCRRVSDCVGRRGARGIEADYDAPQILPCGGPDHIRPKMAGKFCRNGHNFTEPLFVALAVLRIEQMADNGVTDFCCAMTSSLLQEMAGFLLPLSINDLTQHPSCCVEAAGGHVPVNLNKFSSWGRTNAANNAAA